MTEASRRCEPVPECPFGTASPCDGSASFTGGTGLDTAPETTRIRWGRPAYCGAGGPPIAAGSKTVGALSRSFDLLPDGVSCPRFLQCISRLVCNEWDGAREPDAEMILDLIYNKLVTAYVLFATVPGIRGLEGFSKGRTNGGPREAPGVELR